MPSIEKCSALIGAMTIGLALACGETAAAQSKTCSPQEAQAADAAVDHMDSWAKLDQAFRKYGHCDDGSIAEGNSEAVARLLVDHWNTLPALARLVKRDPALMQFVLRHVDSTLDTDDLDRIDELASSKCPEGAGFLCNQLHAAALEAAK